MHWFYTFFCQKKKKKPEPASMWCNYTNESILSVKGCRVSSGQKRSVTDVLWEQHIQILLIVIPHVYLYDLFYSHHTSATNLKQDVNYLHPNLRGGECYVILHCTLTICHGQIHQVSSKGESCNLDYTKCRPINSFTTWRTQQGT